METKFIRDIVFYKDFYLDFYDTLNPNVQKKLNWTLQLIATMDRIPEKYFKHMTGSAGFMR